MKSIKQYILILLASLTLASSLSSCATVFGGRVTDVQKRKPMPGEPQRRVRAGALIADIMLFPLISIPVDFATGAIYKPKQTIGQATRTTQPISAKQPTKK